MKNKSGIERRWNKYKVKYRVENGHTQHFYLASQTMEEAKQCAIDGINKIPMASFISIERSYRSDDIPLF